MNYDHWFQLHCPLKDNLFMFGEPIQVRKQHHWYIAFVEIEGIRYCCDGHSFTWEMVDPALPVSDAHRLAYRRAHRTIRPGLKTIARSLNDMPAITHAPYVATQLRPWWESQRQARFIRPIERIEPHQGGTL